MSKVVRIIGRMCGSGPPRQVAYLHGALRECFETVLIVGRIETGEHDMRYLLKDTTAVYEVESMSRSVKLWSDLVSLIRIVRVLQREKPDIVHTHTAKAGALGRVAALLAGVPIRVHTYHGHVFDGYFGPAATRQVIAIERLLNRFTTQVIAISPSQVEDLVSRFRVARREQVAMVRTGFDLAALIDLHEYRDKTRQELGLNQDDRLVVWAGRLVPIKNVSLLLEVVRSAKRLPRLKFLVMGEGELWPAVEEASKHCDNLRALHWQRDMRPFLAAADMALITSRNEGTPALLIEAMAAGKPFVSTAIGGVVDLAGERVREMDQGCCMAENGFLTSSDPASILACLEALASSPQLAAQMGAAGRSFALAHHAQQRLAEELTGLYRSLLARKGLRKHATALATSARADIGNE